MLESPLKKSKPSYPIDFSIKKKQQLNSNTKKYDISTNEQNPQNLSQKNSSIFSKKYSGIEIPIQSIKKPSQKLNQKEEIPQFQSNKTTNNINKLFQNQISNNNKLDIQDLDQPLKQVKRKNDRIIVDQNKLKNPRIEMNQQKIINKTQRTLQIQSPIAQLRKQQKVAQIGGIKHQNLQNLQKYQNQKQYPLIPEQPYDLINRHQKRNSLLNKLKLNKMQDSYYNQSNNGNNHNSKSYVDSQIYSGKKFFRPETYTYANYANQIIQNQNHNNDQNQNIKRAKSSFQMHNPKKQKIIYINKGNNDNFSFNLPNISLQNDTNKFKKNLTSNNFSLNSKFANKQIIGRLIPVQNKFSNLKNQQQQMKSKFQPNQISKLKAQINLIARNRFRNKDDHEDVNQTQRQFTFHGERQKNSSFSQDNKKLSNSHQFTPKKRLQITYHVPLVQLKTICKKYLSDTNSYRIAFKVPKIFMQQTLFTRNQSKNQLHQNALILFESLKISSKNLIVKRYSNCIIFTAGHIAVIWYYNGKRYLGGWQYQYLDEGSRHGLGLEWQPNSYIYYGQFRNNKKYGLGALKQGPQQILVGYWSNQKYIGTNFRQEDEGLESQKEDPDEQPEQAYFNRNYQNQESDLQYKE